MNILSNGVYWVAPWLMATAIGPSVLGPLAGDNSMDETADLKSVREREQSFLKVLDDHQALIHKICLSYCSNRSDEQDLYQEIVGHLWIAYPSFRGESELSTWIYQVAIRSAILPFRRILRLQFEDVDLEKLPGQTGSEGIDDELFNLIRRLDKTDRAILVFMAEGFTNTEIGAIVGMDRAAVSMRMSRIKGNVEKH